MSLSFIAYAEGGRRSATPKLAGLAGARPSWNMPSEAIRTSMLSISNYARDC